MLSNTKKSKVILVLTGAATAYAVYKYATMDTAKKQKLVSDLRNQVSKILDQYIPNDIKSFFENTQQTGDAAFNAAVNDMSKDDDMRL